MLYRPLSTVTQALPAHSQQWAPQYLPRPATLDLLMGGSCPLHTLARGTRKGRGVKPQALPIEQEESLTLAGRLGTLKVTTMENSSGKRSHLKKILEAGKLRAWGAAAESWSPRAPWTCITLTPTAEPSGGTASASTSRGRRSVSRKSRVGYRVPGCDFSIFTRALQAGCRNFPLTSEQTEAQRAYNPMGLP